MNVLLLALFLTCFPFAKWEQGRGWEYNDGVEVTVDGNDDRDIEWESVYPVCRIDVKAGDGQEGTESVVYDPPVYEGVASDPDHGISHITFYREDNPTAVSLGTTSVQQDDSVGWPFAVMMLGLLCMITLVTLAFLYFAMRR